MGDGICIWEWILKGCGGGGGLGGGGEERGGKFMVPVEKTVLS